MRGILTNRPPMYLHWAQIYPWALTRLFFPTLFFSQHRFLLTWKESRALANCVNMAQ
jgi:hypothetical protein